LRLKLRENRAKKEAAVYKILFNKLQPNIPKEKKLIISTKIKIN
jgi:hypothetical protein